MSPHPEDADRVFRAINAERHRHRLPPLAPLTEAQRAAGVQASDMARNRFMGHGGSDGTGPAQRLEREGFHWGFVAENLSFGYPSPEAAVQGWMESPGHRANILAVAATLLGTATASNETGLYRAAVFAAPLQ